MHRRNFMLGSAALAGAFAFPITLRAQSATAATWISPSTITPLQSYVLIGIENGYFKEAGISLTPNASPGTASAITQLAAGQAHFAQAASITSVPAIVNEGAGIKTIAQPIYRSVFELASRPDAPIKRPQDLVGKTVGLMSVGGSTDSLLDAMMIAEGLDPKSVNKVVTGLSAGAVAFLERGEVDAFWSYYPIRVALDQRGIELFYLSSDEFAPLPPDSVICSAGLLEDENGRKLVEAYLTGCKRGYEFLLNAENVDRCVEILGKYNPVEAEDRDATSRKFEIVRQLAQAPEGVKPFHCDIAAWEQGCKLMNEMGLIKEIPTISDVVTNDVLESADL